jgi:hypothetical protein
VRVDRRGFLSTIVAATVVTPLARFIPAHMRYRPPPSIPYPVSGMSLRLVRDYDIAAASHVTRIDIFYGTSLLRPEFACRVVQGDRQAFLGRLRAYVRDFTSSLDRRN